VCCHHIFFGCLQYPEIFVPLTQALFLETARSHSEPNQGNRFLDQKLLDREHLVGCSIVMMDNPIVGPKFSPFTASLNCFNIST
jgi:hypothetical protein